MLRVANPTNGDNWLLKLIFFNFFMFILCMCILRSRYQKNCSMIVQCLFKHIINIGAFMKLEMR